MLDVFQFAFEFLIYIIRILRQTFFIYWIYVAIIALVISLVLFLRGHNGD